MPSSTAPTVRLGRTCRGGLAPSIFALVERGVLMRPEASAGVRGRVALRFLDGFPPVSIVFGPDLIEVADLEPSRPEASPSASAAKPDLVLSARLADIVLLTTASMRMGVPNPADARGRAVLGRMATGRIRISGDLRLARGMLELMRIEVPPGTRVAPAPEALAPEPGPAGWIDHLT